MKINHKVRYNNWRTRKINPVRDEKGQVPAGRTLSVQNKVTNPKSNKPNERHGSVVLDSNGQDLAIDGLSSKQTPNTTLLKGYSRNGKDTYYRNIIDVGSEEKPIRIDGKTIKENHRNMDLPPEYVNQIKDTVFKHTRQSRDNITKINEFRKRQRH